MRYLRTLLLAVLHGGALLFGNESCAQPIYNTASPWTYWWWMGSAVDSVNIQRQLLSFSSAGFGGVHIIPIYGVKGREDQFKPFLGDRWLDMLAYTTEQASQLGLGVDLTMGTGWPFGGAHITPELAAKKFTLADGRFTAVPTEQQVKRAAPGGEGPVLDHFDSAAARNYFAPFEKLDSIAPRVRALYNDSFEAYGANWTERFEAEFLQRRGYVLSDQVGPFTDTTASAHGIAVRTDYQQTLSELLHDGLTVPWTRWAKRHGYLTRNQAHGSPANILDLYALADIPETESFGTSRFPIPGLRVDEHYEVDRFGTPDPLAMKFASSAAHLAGRKLVSAETGTWLADHFKVSLSQLKPQIDELFTAGINHIFYHGITYTPEEEGFPGWLFYASTNFGTQSHLWKHLPLLNAYVTRCQQRLQESTPDNDILLYFPMHDLWAKTPAGGSSIQYLDAHYTEKWLRGSPFGKVAASLQAAGLTFDYVSDSLLMQVKMSGRQPTMADRAYRVIIVPPVEYMPVRTLQQLNRLAQAGARVLFVDRLPRRPAGFRQRESETFASLLRAGNSAWRVSPARDLVDASMWLGAREEGFAALGLSFIRRRAQDSVFYFVANLENRFRTGWVKVSGDAPGYTLYDPLTMQSKVLPVRRTVDRHTAVFLELPPGASAFLLPAGSAGSARAAKDWTMIALTGKWHFAFGDGIPHIDSTATLDTPRSWTTLADSAAFFYGSGSYRLSFTATDRLMASKDVMLDLGDVREVAEVSVNGTSIGTAWCIPFRLRIPAGLLQKENTIEITVSNLSANYMRLYDERHPEWKKFYDINLVDIQYKPYTAANGPVMPSGLMGGVKIGYRE